LNRRADPPEENTQQELDSSHWVKNLQLAFAGEGGEQMEGIQAANLNATHPTPHAHEKATCRGLTLCMSEKTSSSPLQTTEAAPKQKPGCLVEQTSQGANVPQ